jgi:hypothetical protein
MNLLPCSVDCWSIGNVWLSQVSCTSTVVHIRMHVCRIGSFTLIHFSAALTVMMGYFSFVGYMHNKARFAEGPDTSAVEQPLLGTSTGGSGG